MKDGDSTARAAPLQSCASAQAAEQGEPQILAVSDGGVREKRESCT